MAKQQNVSAAKRTIQDIIAVAVISICIFLLIITVVCSRYGVEANWDRVDLSSSDDIIYHVHRTDGSIEYYTTPNFSPLHAGDILTVTIPPIGIKAFSDAALVFTLYHSKVNVYNDNQCLYAENYYHRPRLIGQRNYVISLPDDYMRTTIVITARVSENDTVDQIANFQIIPDTVTTYAFMANKTHTLILYIAIFTMSLLFFCYAIVHSMATRHVSNLLYMTSFGMSITVWLIGYNDLLSVFIPNQDLSSTIEYTMFFLAPTPLALFMQDMIRRKPWHLLCIIFAVIMPAEFTIATICNFLITDITYIDLMRFHRVLFLGELVVFLLCLISEQRHRKDTALRTVDIGFLLSALFAILDIIRFALENRFGFRYDFLYYSFAPVSVLLMMGSLLIYSDITTAEASLWKVEQANLRRLAFVDQMTGVPNRSSCYRQIDALKKSGRTEFVMIFVDINFLKLTNDTWGHEKGDELIRTVGELLKKRFSDNGFYGRWGGDEFIACHFGTLEETKKLMGDLEQEMEQLNASGRFDFRMSLSWGYGESTEKAPLTPEQAINSADEAMYVAKKVAHAARA